MAGYIAMRNTFYLYDNGCEFSSMCRDLARRCGMAEIGAPDVADVALAPLLAKRLSPDQWRAPHYGTLVFHPSALPYRRGPDAIRHTVAAGERVSAATWFWCDNNLDTGDICEQEVVVLHPGESAGRAYHTRFVPAALVALERALDGVVRGEPRRRPQDHRLATTDSWLPTEGGTRA